jgi:hypothetical protein
MNFDVKKLDIVHLMLRFIPPWEPAFLGMISPARNP